MDRAALIRECRDALGLTQAAFAEILWVKPRIVRYWEAGGRAVPGPVWVALSLMLEKRTSKRNLLRRIDALMQK